MLAEIGRWCLLELHYGLISTVCRSWHPLWRSIHLKKLEIRSLDLAWWWPSRSVLPQKFLNRSRGSRFSGEFFPGAVTAGRHYELSNPAFIRLKPPSALVIADSRCKPFTYVDYSSTFLYLIFCQPCLVCRGLPWPSRLPSASWYVESPPSHCAYLL